MSLDQAVSWLLALGISNFFGLRNQYKIFKLLYIHFLNTPSSLHCIQGHRQVKSYLSIPCATVEQAQFQLITKVYQFYLPNIHSG